MTTMTAFRAMCHVAFRATERLEAAFSHAIFDKTNRVESDSIKRFFVEFLHSESPFNDLSGFSNAVILIFFSFDFIKQEENAFINEHPKLAIYSLLVKGGIDVFIVPDIHTKSRYASADHYDDDCHENQQMSEANY